ncbi:hypothetical protein MHH56_09510 [Paenibacillus sp. FSL K6-3182]|uniref:hypothetical protein n=1 Tax=Paenibacillus sp. FSL K6-3182 TaxID=2921495 RepID=UPI0030D07863
MNEKLTEIQKQQREETVKKVQDVIEFIKLNEGDYAVLTLQKLIHYSGGQLYKSILYKEHVLKIWNPKKWEYKYGKRRVFKDYEYDKNVKLIRKEVEGLEQKLNDAESKNSKLRTENEKLNDKYKGIKVMWEEERELNARLRGEILQLQSRLSARENE